MESAVHDVVDLIMQDHRDLERLFDELRTHPERRPLLVPMLTTLLTAHSRAEEIEVYPVARNESDQADDVAHSQEEHAEAEQLLARLAETDPEASEFDQVLSDLIESICHHVEDEESSLLAGMRERLDDERRAELGRAFAASREAHLGDQPGEATKEELRIQARNAGISGTSTMSKDELIEELHKLSS